MKQSTFLADFRAFVMRGNVLDMAVGVVVGGAFSQIVSSLVSDIIMPAIGMLTGGVNLSALAVTLRAAEGDAEAVVLGYGMFLQNVVDFLLIALSVFVAIRLIGKLRRQAPEAAEEPAPAEQPAPTPEQTLLAEIRDLLKNR